jgi:hypothetical protein
MRGYARWVRRTLAVSWASILLAWPALAQVPQGTGVSNGNPPLASAGTASQGQRIVDVTIVGGGEGAETLMQTIRELVGRLGLGVNPHLLSSPDTASARSSTGGLAPGSMSVTVDMVSRYEAVATVKGPSGEVRRGIPRDGSPSIVREVIGEAVRSSVEALLMAEQVPKPEPPPVVAPPEPPPTLVAPVPAPPPPDVPAANASNRWFALDITTFAGGGPVSSNSGIVPRVGGGVVLGSREGRRPSLTIEGAYLVPFAPTESVQGETVTVRTILVSMRAVASMELARMGWGAVDVGAGAGADVVTVDRPGSAMDANVSTKSSTKADPVLAGLVTGYASLTPGVALTLAAGVEWDVTPAAYYVAAGSGRSDIFVPWRVRPLLLAGFTFTAVGNGRFTGKTP